MFRDLITYKYINDPCLMESGEPKVSGLHAVFTGE